MRKLLYILTTLFLVTACTGDEIEPVVPIPNDECPIAFACIMENETNMQQGSGRSAIRRKAPTTLAQNFKLWGYKTTATGTQSVFDGYNIEYKNGTAGTTESNTHDYDYVGVENNELSGGIQTIKYWDFGASAYRFWGATGGEFSANGTTLTIPGLSLSTAEPTTPLFSALYHRSPVSSEVVQLQFKRPYSKVRVMFYNSEELTGDDQVLLTDISFGGGTGSIATSGELVVTYPTTGTTTETITLTNSATQDALTFNGVTLDATHGTTSNNAVLAVPTGGTDWYYTLPLSTTATAPAFTLNATIDGEAKTATIPTAYMQWKPNTSYTYIFKISESGNKLDYGDVIIEPWLFGGSQDEEWRNW